MNYFEKILFFLQAEMTEPKAFGWFHFMWMILVIIFIIFLYKIKKYYNEKQLKIVLGTYGIIAFILELLKQLIWTFNYDSITKIVTWDYQWYSFPFQLCTTPIFISIIALFLKKGKLRDSLLSYLSYVTILGSISVILLPDSCFVKDILVNIHTMWLHMGSFVISIYLLIVKEVKTDFNSFKNSIKILLIFIFLALILNIIVYNSNILNGETFNMFYISPYFISSLPIFNTIQQNIPYLLFLLIYILVLIIGAFIIYNLAKLIKKII